MSAYLHGNKYYVVQKRYENLNLGFLIQAWTSGFQNSECIGITRDGIKKSWIPALHLQKSHVWAWIIGFPPSPGLATPAHVSLSGIRWGCFPVQISRGPPPAPCNLWGYRAVLADPLRPSQWCLSDLKAPRVTQSRWLHPVLFPECSCYRVVFFCHHVTLLLVDCFATFSHQLPEGGGGGGLSLHRLSAARPLLTEVGVDGLCP